MKDKRSSDKNLLDLMITCGIRWATVIKINPEMANKAAYVYYHRNNHKK